MTLKVDVIEKSRSMPDPYKCSDMKKTEQKLFQGIKDTLKSTWDFRSKITVEPFVICYILPSVLAGFAVQNLCFEKSCLVNLHYDQDVCRHIMDGHTQNYTEEEKNVQAMVSTMTAWSFPLQTALPGIMALFVGSWSDRTGNRKLFMVLPILGKLTSALGLILSIAFFLQVGVNETALLDGLPPALAGGRVAMTTSVYSYIADITSDSERTFRIGIITAILTLSRPVGLALGGIMTRKLGYYGVFMFACAVYFLGFVYIACRLKKPEKLKSVDSGKSNSILSLFALEELKNSLKVALKKRKGSKRLQLNIILLAYMCIVGPVLGEAQMTYWFTRYKFHFTEVDYSLFLTYSVILGTIGSFFMIYVISNRWKVSDSMMGVMACVSRISSSIVYSFAPTRTVYFIGPILDMISSVGATSLRSIATKLVEADEVGKASSLISVSESLIPVVYAPIYTKIYLNTLTTFPGAFYLVSAAVGVPAIALFIILKVLREKQFANEEEQTAANKDKITKTNEITRF